MAEEPRQLPAPESVNENWMLPILVFFAAFVVMLLLVMNNASTSAGLTLADKDVSVHFTEPADGAEVVSPFDVRFEAKGVVVEPAGEVHAGAGHFHVLIDTDFIAAGEAIPNDETHLHFGDAALQTVLNLPPGQHTLRLQFADGAHQALEGDQYRDEITVKVSE
jgi:Domain of unknown function (DUF4399)